MKLPMSMAVFNGRLRCAFVGPLEGGASQGGDAIVAANARNCSSNFTRHIRPSESHRKFKLQSVAIEN